MYIENILNKVIIHVSYMDFCIELAHAFFNLQLVPVVAQDIPIRLCDHYFPVSKCENVL